LPNAYKDKAGFKRQAFKEIIIIIAVGIIPFLIAMTVLDLWRWDMSVPLVYAGSDDTWQLVLTKALRDTGWILDIPFLGAPDVAHWHLNAAAQTSAIHSIVMLGLSNFIDDAVKLQQVYYLLNFPLIAITAYFASRLLGIARFAAVSIAILFSFTSFRIGWMFYAFLANYFAVPLALIPIFWILTGEFHKLAANDKNADLVIRRILGSRKFFLSLFFILLVTLSDGYFAFFTLLLLGFATSIRAVYGDIRQPVSLVAPLLLIAALISVALAVSMPLNSYQRTHIEEFYPEGKADPSVLKRPFEAEVYSSSLKLLIAPIPEHRIKIFGELGQYMIDTSNDARKFPQSKPMISLGTIGSTLFLASLIILWLTILRQTSSIDQKTTLPCYLKNNDILWAAIALTIFIFLFSISGGIGTLISLIYPTIRAYDRFPLFLIFCLFLGAGAAITARVRDATRFQYIVAVGLVVALTGAGLYDQIPFNAAKGDTKTRDRFLAERSFVKKIEAILPVGAMVYQYPHSQYLSDSKYYGWGSFSHIRLYLHSNGLHWSNGASKNSPVEKWHEKIANLPISQLITEIEAVGFKGFVIDRAVVSQAEYEKLQSEFAKQGLEFIENTSSNLTFSALRDPGFRIVYDHAFQDPIKIVITDISKISISSLPRLINSTALEKILRRRSGESTYVIERAAHPEVFFTTALLDRGDGKKPITPLSVMRGKLDCSIRPSTSTSLNVNVMVIKIENNSDFDWQFNQGAFPLKVGVHLRGSKGSLLQWDDGSRFPNINQQIIEGKNSGSEIFSVPAGKNVEIKFPLTSVNLHELKNTRENLTAEFQVVQDGHAWFEKLICSVPMTGSMINSVKN
jgi:hypothetical protein